jgi:hypothetical protein
MMSYVPQGVTHQGSHEPVVSREIWNRAQEVTRAKHRF